MRDGLCRRSKSMPGVLVVEIALLLPGQERWKTVVGGVQYGGVLAAFYGIFQHQILAVLQFRAYRQVAQQVDFAAIVAQVFGGCALAGADKSPRSFHFRVSFLNFGSESDLIHYFQVGGQK